MCVLMMEEVVGGEVRRACECECECVVGPLGEKLCEGRGVARQLIFHVSRGLTFSLDRTLEFPVHFTDFTPFSHPRKRASPI